MSADHITPELQEIDRLILTGERDPSDSAWQGNMLLFMARRVRYMMERETITISECDVRMAACPARAIMRGDWKTMALQQSPWVLVVGYLAWRLHGG